MTDLCIDDGVTEMFIDTGPTEKCSEIMTGAPDIIITDVSAPKITTPPRNSHRQRLLALLGAKNPSLADCKPQLQSSRCGVLELGTGNIPVNEMDHFYTRALSHAKQEGASVAKTKTPTKSPSSGLPAGRRMTLNDLHTRLVPLLRQRRLEGLDKREKLWKLENDERLSPTPSDNPDDEDADEDGEGESDEEGSSAGSSNDDMDGADKVERGKTGDEPSPEKIIPLGGSEELFAASDAEKDRLTMDSNTAGSVTNNSDSQSVNLHLFLDGETSQGVNHFNLYMEGETPQEDPCSGLEHNVMLRDEIRSKVPIICSNESVDSSVDLFASSSHLRRASRHSSIGDRSQQSSAGIRTTDLNREHSNCSSLDSVYPYQPGGGFKYGGSKRQSSGEVVRNSCSPTSCSPSGRSSGLGSTLVVDPLLDGGSDTNKSQAQRISPVVSLKDPNFLTTEDLKNIFCPDDPNKLTKAERLQELLGDFDSENSNSQTQQLLNLCSGQFNNEDSQHYQQHLVKPGTRGVALFNEEDAHGGAISPPLPNSGSANQQQQALVLDPDLFDDAGAVSDDEAEMFHRSRFVEEESQEDNEDDDGGGVSDNDDADDEGDDADDINDDDEGDGGSDDELAVVRRLEEEREVGSRGLRNTKGRLRAEFVEKEAELSGSDVGSADEMEGPDDNMYEAEEGDLDDLPSEDELRNQVGRIHLKHMLDEDKRHMMRAQEAMEDRMAVNRRRRFRWRDDDDDVDLSAWNDDGTIDLDAAGSDPEDHDTVQLASQAQESIDKRLWLQTHAERVFMADDEQSANSENSLLSRVIVRRQSTSMLSIGTEDSVVDRVVTSVVNEPRDDASKVNGVSLSAPIVCEPGSSLSGHRDSLLRRGGATLAKLKRSTTLGPVAPPQNVAKCVYRRESPNKRASSACAASPLKKKRAVLLSPTKKLDTKRAKVAVKLLDAGSSPYLFSALAD